MSSSPGRPATGNGVSRSLSPRMPPGSPTLDLSRLHNKLQANDEPLGEKFLTTYRRPKSAPFPTAKREAPVGGGPVAANPAGFTWTPRNLGEPEVLAEFKSGIGYTIPKSTREQWAKSAVIISTTAEAGPGAYQVEPAFDALSTSRSRTLGATSFPHSPRDAAVSGAVVPGRDARGVPIAPGPYETSRAVGAVLPRSPMIPFGRGKRPIDKHDDPSPGPYIVKAIEKHTPRAHFGTSAGHEASLAPPDLATAQVPMYLVQRPAKQSPRVKFGTSPRFK